MSQTTPFDLDGTPSILLGAQAEGSSKVDHLSGNTMDAAEDETFGSLCRPTSMQDLERLSRKIATHLDLIEEAEFDNALVDANLAHRLADALTMLVRDASSLDADGRASLRGALEYFLLTNDGEDDVISPTGLQDDARVVNHVCALLGRSELAVVLV